MEQAELPALLKRLVALPHLPPLEIEESVGIRVVEAPPLPRLKIGKAETLGYSRTGGALAGELSFGYGERVVGARARGCGEYLEEAATIVLRRRREEQQAARASGQAGLSPSPGSPHPGGGLQARRPPPGREPWKLSWPRAGTWRPKAASTAPPGASPSR